VAGGSAGLSVLSGYGPSSIRGHERWAYGLSDVRPPPGFRRSPHEDTAHPHFRGGIAPPVLPGLVTHWASRPMIENIPPMGSRAQPITPAEAADEDQMADPPSENCCARIPARRHHRRTRRGAGAADRDRRGVARHQFLARRSRAGVRSNFGQGAPFMRCCGLAAEGN
jgi:hypothetical protein